MADPVGAVKRELLVRYLQAWAPAALHRSRRATFVHGYADRDGGQAAEAALRALAEAADLLRGRSLAMVALAADPEQPQRRLAAVQQQLDLPPALTVHCVTGEPDDRLAVALTAATAARAPVLGYLDAAGAPAPALATVAAMVVGRPAEALLVLDRTALSGDGLDDYRTALRDSGFPLVTAVELVGDPDDGQLLFFATSSGKSLEQFKDELWAVDEYAGVRYRDPGDPERHLLDISLQPHPGPLRRELLEHVAAVGECTVTDLRTFTMTETVYRAADATRVIHTLVDTGALIRQPDSGRLGGDVRIRPGAVVVDPGGG